MSNLNLELLTSDDVKKAMELRKVYGLKGLSDVINVKQEQLKHVLETSDTFDLSTSPKAIRSIRVGIRRYWKSWMRKTQA